MPEGKRSDTNFTLDIQEMERVYMEVVMSLIKEAIAKGQTEVDLPLNRIGRSSLVL